MRYSVGDDFRVGNRDVAISVKCDREQILLLLGVSDGFRAQFTRLSLATLRYHLEAHTALFFWHLTLFGFRPVRLPCVVEFLDQKHLLVHLRLLVLELVDRKLLLRSRAGVVLKNCK